MPGKTIGYIIAAMVLVAAVIGGVFYSLNSRPHETVAKSALPTPLYAGFNSLQTVDSVTAELDRRGLPWEKTGESKLPNGDTRPEYSFVAITSTRFLNNEFLGAMTFTFFNDRLMEMKFLPENVADFQRAISEESGVDLKKGRLVLPFTEIREFIDNETRSGVMWRDIRLQEEQQRWIARYS